MKVSIQARMIGFIFVPCMLGLICLGGLSGYFASDSIHKQNNAAMTEILSRQSSELNNMALLTGDIMESFAGERCVSELLKAAAAGTIPEDRRQEAMRLISHMSKVCSTLDQIGILTPEGLVVAHITPASIGTKRSYFSPDGKAHVINTRSGTKREITAVFTVPVMRDGQVIGHVYATTPMKSLAERTIGSFHLYDHSVSGVYDARGTVLMHSDPARQGADDSGKSWVRDMLTKGSGFMTYADEEKQRHLLYFTSLPALGWTIMLDVPAAEAEEPLRTMLYIIAAASVLILLCCGSVIIWITRDMAGSIHDLTSFSLLVADGNLEITPEQQKMLDRHARRSDELGALSRSVEAMARNMGGMVQQAERKTREAEHAALKASEATTRAESASRDAFQALRVQHEAASRLEEVVASVSAAVTQLSTQITSSAQGADNQARRVSETATAMEEMNASVLEVAKNAACTADISEQARQKGQGGAAVVQQVIQGMSRVNASSEALHADMAELSQKAASIGSILDVISDIADQTNLLALNAAIEAARAGEAGRGFAVVADEVRKLAEKTMQATGEVGRAVQGIQQGTAKNAENVESATATVREVMELAAHSGQALEEIVALVEQASDQVRGIATASEEQSASSEEIHQAIDSINGISAATAEAMHLSSDSVQELMRQSQVLLQLIQEMRREGETQGQNA